MAISKTYIVLLPIINSYNENIITKKSRLGDSPMSPSYTLFVNIKIVVLCLFKCSKDYIVRFLTNSSPKPNYCIAYYLYGFPISLALRLKIIILLISLFTSFLSLAQCFKQKLFLWVFRSKWMKKSMIKRISVADTLPTRTVGRREGAVVLMALTFVGLF